MTNALPDRSRTSRRVVACALVLGLLALVALLPWTAPLVGVGLLSWGLATVRRTEDKIVRGIAVAGICLGSVLVVITVAAFLTQFRTR